MLTNLNVWKQMEWRGLKRKKSSLRISTWNNKETTKKVMKRICGIGNWQFGRGWFHDSLHELISWISERAYIPYISSMQNSKLTSSFRERETFFLQKFTSRRLSSTPMVRLFNAYDWFHGYSGLFTMLSGRGRVDGSCGFWNQCRRIEGRFSENDFRTGRLEYCIYMLELSSHHHEFFQSRKLTIASIQKPQ